MLGRLLSPCYCSRSRFNLRQGPNKCWQFH